MAQTINQVAAIALLCLGLVGLWYAVRLPARALIPFALVGAAQTLAMIAGPGGDPLHLVAWIALLGVYALTQRFPGRAEQALQAACWIVSIAIIAEWMALRPARAGFGNPNMIASLLLLLWPVGSQWPVWIVALLLTGSRGAIIGAGFVLVLKARGWQLAAVLTLLAAVLLIALRPQTLLDVRLTEWIEGYQLWRGYPLTGWGPGSIPIIYADPGRVHLDSWPITVLVELGLLGLGAWIGAGVLWAQHSRPHPRRGALLAWLIHQIADCTLGWPLVGMALMVSLALITREENNGDVAG